MGRLTTFIRENNLAAMIFVTEHDDAVISRKGVYYIKLALKCDCAMLDYVCSKIPAESISVNDFDNLILAARHDNAILYFLLHRYPEHKSISNQVCVVLLSTEGMSLACISNILPRISPRYDDLLMSGAIQFANISMVKILCQKLQPQNLEPLADTAIKYDKRDIMCYLYQQGLRLTGHHMLMAHNRQAMECLVYFRERIGIQDYDNDIARYAVTSHNMELLQKLCLTGFIADSDFVNFTLRHMMQHDLDLTILVMIRNYICDQYQVPIRILTQAVDKRLGDIINWLVVSGFVIRQTLDLALNSAAESGLVDMVKLLSSLGGKTSLDLVTLCINYSEVSQIGVLYLLFDQDVVDAVDYNSITQLKPAVKAYFRYKHLLRSGYGLQKLAAIAYHEKYHILPDIELIPENVYLRLYTTSKTIKKSKPVIG